MSFLSKVSLKAKILLAFVFSSLVLVTVGAISANTLSSVTKSYTHVAEMNLPNSIAIGEMVAQLFDADAIVRTFDKTKSDEELNKAIEEYKKAIALYMEADKTYNDVPFVAGEEDLYKPTASGVQKYQELVETVIAKVKAKEHISNHDKYQEFLDKTLDETHNKTIEALKTLVRFHQSEGKKWAQKSADSASSGSTTLNIVIGIGVLLSLVIGFFIATFLGKRLTIISTEIDAAALETNSAGTSLSAASQDLSASSSEAAASLEETVASLEEVTGMTKTNADNAKIASGLSETSREAAARGEREIAKLIEAMSNISTGSKKIEEIINVIDDIAFQTNLLALNAAVEAARAGEQGKGFAVVAEAVRSLAQRSAIAAKDIAGLIGENVQKSAEGAKFAQSSGVVLGEIVGNVKKVADLVQEISTASGEQATGIEQISKAMNQLDRAIQGNAASSEEVAANAEQMTTQSRQLNQLVNNLKEVVEGSKLRSRPDESDKHEVSERKPKTKAAA